MFLNRNHSPAFKNPLIAAAIRHGGRIICALCLFILALSASKAFASESPGSMMPISINEEQLTSPELQSTLDIIFGLFIGIMLTASLYLFFIWIVLRDRGQIILMFLLAALGINMATSNMSMMHILGIHGEAMPNLLQSYSMIGACIFSIFFSIYFLELDTTAPKMKTPLFVFVSILCGLLIVTIFNQTPANLALPMLSDLAISFVLLTGLTALWQGVSGSLSHLTAFCFFLLGKMAEPLHTLGYIPDETTSNNLTYAGFSVATIVFAIVIAGQFAARQEEKEKELQRSNERFTLAARGSNEGLFEWNKATEQVYFSGQFRRLLGVALVSNTKGLKEWARLIHPADRKTVFKNLKTFEAHPSASTISFEYRVKSGEKGWHWIHTKAVATRDPITGHINRLVGSIGDITQRKLSEVRLRASEARFRSITEAHPVPVLIVNLDDQTILYASPGAESLLGLPVAMLMSHRLDRFLPHANERDALIAAIKSGQEINMAEVNLSRGDAEELPAALSARRISYQNAPAMVIGLYDLTERKLAELQIAEQQEALQQSEKMAALGGLLAGVAHELNNPLSVVMGQTTLLMEGQAEEKTKARAEKIFKAADRCSRIVKSFLALARRKSPERKDINLTPIIHNSLELLGYQFRNENVVLKLNLIENLPPIIGDEDQMTQVFTNLALNAAQAMHEWKGPHELTITTQKQDEQHIRLTFADTGPGIGPELRQKVFEPFFTTKGGVGGTGVGLALCLNIIEGHGGRIIIDETAGGGASFIITFPISLGETTKPAEGTAVSHIDTRQMRILIVDDELELAQTLADLLDPLGHDIDLAINGAIALEKIEKRDFDAIISDLRMPVLDGPGLYAALAEKKPEYTKKIIYVTGDTLSPHVHSFLSETPVPVIEKPYRLVDVQEALAKLLNDTAGHSNINAADSSGSSPT